MFTIDHLIWGIISILIIALLSFFSIKKKFSFKTSATIMAIIALVSETFKIATHMFPVYRDDFLGEGGTVNGFSNAMYLLPKSLPFHMCSILIFFIFYLAISNNQKMIEKVKTFCVPIFIIAGTLSLVINTSFNSSINTFESFTGNLNVLNTYKASGDSLDLSHYLASLNAYQYFIYHACIVWYGIYIIATKQVKFGLHEWIQNSIILFALLVLSIWINSCFIQYGTNFMYVVAPPAKGLPLLNLNHGWYVYMVHYMLIGAIITFLFQLPWIIKEKNNKPIYKA